MRKMTKDFAIRLALNVLNLFNILLHCLGSYLLICLYKRNTKTVQQTYIINLSLTEILACLVMLLEDGPGLIQFDTRVSMTLKDVNMYLYIVIYVVFCVYYWDMILITTDRLAATILHFKYPLYWDKGKAKLTVIGTWAIAMLACVAISVAYKLTKFNFRNIFTKYVHSAFNFIFILFVIYTYSYIFLKYLQRSREPSRNYGQIGEQVQGICGLFCNSKFYVSILLVATFVIFMGIPNLVYLSYHLSDIHIHKLKEALKLFYQFSFLSDAFVYIFMQPAVRRMLLLKLGLIKPTGSSTLYVHRNVVRTSLALSTAHVNISEV